MPMYRNLGQIPHKRHTQFRRPDGKLYTEQLMGSRGFSGRSSLLYHYNMPTQAREIRKIQDCAVPHADEQVLRHHHFKTKGLTKSGDAVSGRVVLLHNSDVSMAIAVPDQKMTYYTETVRATRCTSSMRAPAAFRRSSAKSSTGPVITS